MSKETILIELGSQVICDKKQETLVISNDEGQELKTIISTTDDTLNGMSETIVENGNESKVADQHHLKVECDNSLLGKVQLRQFN